LHACGVGEEVQIGSLAGGELAERTHLKRGLGRYVSGRGSAHRSGKEER
jgi:hypothetical protein